MAVAYEQLPPVDNSTAFVVFFTYIYPLLHEVESFVLNLILSSYFNQIRKRITCYTKKK